MWIQFSEFNYKLLVLLIFPIFRRIQDYTKKSYITSENNYFKTFRYFICHLFSFIPFLIMKKRNKKSTILIENNKDLNINFNNEKDKIGEINKIQKENKKKKLLKNIIFILALCVISFSCYLYRFIFEKSEYKIAKLSIGIFFEISFFVILSFLILKQKLYLHNYISVGIIGFDLLILFIVSIFHMDSDFIFSSFLYYLFYFLLFSLYDVLIKRYLNSFYSNFLLLIAMIGLINSICLIIYDLCAYYLKSEISGVIFGFKNNINSPSNFFLFLLDLIIEFIWIFGIFLTIYIFTPCHYFIPEYISEFCYYIKTAFNSKEEFYSTFNIIIFSISYVIIFFCCLVFNEVIIINFCKLDYNTKKRIQERMNLEKANNENILDDNSDSDEEDSKNNINN